MWYLLWKLNWKPHPNVRMVPVRMTFSDLFKVTIIQRQITWKWYNIQLSLQWPTNRKLYMIYRTAPFSMTLNDPYSQFQGHAMLWRWIYLINGTTYRHSFNEILIGTYTRPIIIIIIIIFICSDKNTWCKQRAHVETWTGQQGKKTTLTAALE